jgi:hypothetical protein
MGAASNGKQPFVLSVIFDDVGIISIFLASSSNPARRRRRAGAACGMRARIVNEFINSFFKLLHQITQKRKNYLTL